MLAGWHWGWQFALTLPAALSTIFAILNTILYIYNNRKSWFLSWPSKHLAASFGAISFVLAAAAISSAVGAIPMDNIYTKLYAIFFWPLPLTQVWRFYMLVVSLRSGKEKG